MFTIFTTVGFAAAGPTQPQPSATINLLDPAAPVPGDSKQFSIERG